ncbi:hypothetical protein Tco_1047835 [Tanacetum coccineum]
MASGGSDRDAEDALSKLLQMGTVVEYQDEFEMLINQGDRLCIHIGESNEVHSKFGEFLDNKESVVEVVGGGEALGVYREKSCEAKEGARITLEGVFLSQYYPQRFYLDDGLRRNNMLMSFDMTCNEFIELYLPDSLSNYSEIRISISKLRESLVVLEWNTMRVKRVFGVWMMENDNPKLFTKLYTID